MTLLIKPAKSKNTLNGVSDTMIEVIDVAGTIYAYSNIEPSYWHFGKSIKNLQINERGYLS